MTGTRSSGTVEMTAPSMITCVRRPRASTNHSGTRRAGVMASSSSEDASPALNFERYSPGASRRLRAGVRPWRWRMPRRTRPARRAAAGVSLSVFFPRYCSRSWIVGRIVSSRIDRARTPRVVVMFWVNAHPNRLPFHRHSPAYGLCHPDSTLEMGCPAEMSPRSRARHPPHESTTAGGGISK